MLSCKNNPCWSLQLPQSVVWIIHSDFILFSLLIKMLCSTEQRTDSYRNPTENVPGLQVYWHLFVCKFLIQLESQIDLVSLFSYKNVLCQALQNSVYLIVTILAFISQSFNLIKMDVQLNNYWLVLHLCPLFLYQWTPALHYFIYEWCQGQAIITSIFFVNFAYRQDIEFQLN